jgi:hypothetical protein
MTGIATFERPSRWAGIDGLWWRGRWRAIECEDWCERRDFSPASDPGGWAGSGGTRRDSVPRPISRDAVREWDDVERNSGTFGRRTGDGAPQA